MTMAKLNEAERLYKLTEYERKYWNRGVTPGGMDEAGRGPLAGPVVAACVIMPDTPLIEKVNDSKKLSEKRREALYPEIVNKALSFGVGIVCEADIDKINILNATRLAFKRAYDNMIKKPSLVLVDALKNLDIEAEQIPIIHGDAISYSIAAASIIAKVTRDRLMLKLHQEYPEYGFSSNKGYATKAHIDALIKYGPCPVHRLSFIGNFIEVGAWKNEFLAVQEKISL